MSLLRPLLLDIVPTIQQTAALALGRLANYNDDLSEAVVKADILPQLVYSLAEQNVSTFIFLLCKFGMLSQSLYVFMFVEPIYLSIYYVTLSQRFYKKAAAFVLRAVAKHSAQHAQVSHYLSSD